MGTDYVQMLLDSTLEMERSETSDILESIDYELAYIQNVVGENSLLTEKLIPKSSEGPVTKLINSIRSIFEKFVTNAKKLIADLKPWKDAYLDKLNSISYNGITISAIPHWEMSAEEIISEIEKMITAFDRKKDELSRPNANQDSLSVDDIIKTMDPYKKYDDSKNAYKMAMKMVFSTKKADMYKLVDVNNPAKLKEICETGRKYIESYDNILSRCTTLRDKFLRTAEEFEKEQSRQSAKESYDPYLILENRRLSETDLVFCAGLNLLMEDATGDQKNDENKPPSLTETEVKKDETEDNSPDNKKTSSTLTNMIKINTDAITIAITVIEAKLITYKKIIKQVVTVAGEAPNEEVKSDKKTTPQMEKEAKKAKRSIKTAPKRAANRIKGIFSKSKK